MIRRTFTGLMGSIAAFMSLALFAVGVVVLSPDVSMSLARITTAYDPASPGTAVPGSMDVREWTIAYDPYFGRNMDTGGYSALGLQHLPTTCDAGQPGVCPPGTGGTIVPARALNEDLAHGTTYFVLLSYGAGARLSPD